MTREARLYRFFGRHQALFGVIGLASFALVCADYARFIELPDIVTLPAAIGGILTGVRYALWETVVKPRYLAATGGEDATGR